MIRWGILGCGSIARKFASDLKFVEGSELVAVGARELATAEVFAKDFPARYRYGSYEELVQNTEVDVIYIATPHAFHHQHALLCLKHKKAVLCEKAFAMNTREAKEIIDVARAQGVFIMEAFWTLLLPHYQRVKELIAGGALGQINYLYAEFGFIPPHPVKPRLFDPHLGGGSLYDIGVYNVFLALDILGRPDTIQASMTKASSGIDAQCSVEFAYNSGAIAQLFSSLSVHLPGVANIAGDKGRIHFLHDYHKPSTDVEYYEGTATKGEQVAFEKAAGFGYEYEARHVTECLQKGLLESPVLTHELTLLVMETLDQIREKAGIRYPMD